MGIHQDHQGPAQSRRARGKGWVLAAGAALGLGLGGVAQAVPIPTFVKNDCMICHGLTGHHTLYPIVPRLAGQHEKYLVWQLQQFNNHHRADHLGQIYMWPVGQGLDAAQIQRAATYFAAQEPMKPSGIEHPGVAEGKQIFLQGVAAEQVPACMACHGPGGLGAQTFPRLAGQRYGYIVQQLDYFHRGTRVNTLMNAVAKNLTPAQMEAVAAYLSSL